MKTAYSVVAENNFRTLFLMTMFLVLVFGLGYIFSYLLQNREIFYGAVIFGVLVNLFSLLWGDKITLALTGAREIKKEDLPEVYRLVENLAITAGLPTTPKVYLIDSPALNAFATGRSPKNSVVALTTGIIEKLNKEELEGVIAHEISHIKNLDIRVMMIATILAGIIAIMADLFLRMTFAGSRDRDKSNALFLLIGFVLAILAPIFAQLITLAISRKREFMADASGALLTRNPEGLASALEKISASTISLDTSPATAHLFIVNPFKDKKGFITWLGNLFSTHPPVEERIKVLRGMII
ncbi:MAG: protease HtpX [Candidatus Parcubacteria bacterium]|nr:MAG: protease HtpX [Candidatus Parcubacteria bacterium]